MSDTSTNSESNTNSSSNSHWLPYMNTYGSQFVITPPPAPQFHTRDDVIGFIVKLKLTMNDSETLAELLYKGKQIDQLIGLAVSIEGGKTNIEYLTLDYLQDRIQMLVKKYNKKMKEFKGIRSPPAGGGRKAYTRKGKAGALRLRKPRKTRTTKKNK